MSLIHSLTVADSLQTPKTAPGRFRMAQHSLPKFAPAKSPISLRPATPVKPGETGSLFDPRPEPAPLEVRISAASVIHATSPALRPEPKPGKTGEAVVVGKAVVEKAAEKKGRGGRIFRDVPWLGGRGAGAREREVQTEWALDRVTVVRNDLSETDLEVVAARRAEPKMGPFTLEGARRENRGESGWWRRLGARLLGRK
jgi:hypothetical protein